MNELSNGQTVPEVVADRVVAAPRPRPGSGCPSPEYSRGPIRWPDDGLRLGRVDDAAPQEVADVRGERVDLGAVRVEGEREVLPLGDPEVAVEAALEVGRLGLELVGVGRVLPDEPGEARAAHLRVVRVALELAGRPREVGQPAVAVRDRVPGVLPGLVLEARSARCAACTRCSRCPCRSAYSSIQWSAARASYSRSRTSLRSPVQRSYSSSRTTYSGVASTEP